MAKWSAALRIIVMGFTTVLIFLHAADLQPAHAWELKRVDTLPTQKERAKAPQGLPDGHVSFLEYPAPISAWYDQPTERYAHGILGDAIEAGRLVVKTAEGGLLTYELPQEQVFEDRTPRLIDFDGFGEAHVVTILSDATQGASIAVFAIVENKLTLVAQTPYIGLANRWRNIAGIDDFDGDGSAQIAEVVTPHIGGTLRFWTWKKGTLVPSGDIDGFSNHAIGSREQGLSAIEDFDGDGVSDIAVPSADRRTLRLIGFDGEATGEKTLKEIASFPLPARVDTAISVSRDDDDVVLAVGLEDGSMYAIHQ